ncbi:hypothetical protein BDZ45DRAFT_771895 [Acephala macrosclerotiorum]|nr:hypothetical protein BDZ45DRAFT_771895 [Acephala macrosclerotiorum]
MQTAYLALIIGSFVVIFVCLAVWVAVSGRKRDRSEEVGLGRVLMLESASALCNRKFYNNLWSDAKCKILLLRNSALLDFGANDRAALLVRGWNRHIQWFRGHWHGTSSAPVSSAYCTMQPFFKQLMYFGESSGNDYKGRILEYL